MYIIDYVFYGFKSICYKGSHRKPNHIINDYILEREGAIALHSAPVGNEGLYKEWHSLIM